jgi:site-specific recombinase xerD
LEKLDIPIEQNPIYRTNTLNFTKITQEQIRQEVKQAVYLHLKYEKLRTVQREISSLRQFSKYLQDKRSDIQSCKDINRELIEEYLIHKATNGSSGKSNGDDILKLRNVLESIGKLFGYANLEGLFINTNIT